MGFAFTTCSEEISLQPSDPSGVEQAYPNEVLSAHWSVAKSLHTVINDRSDAYVSLIGALNDQFDDDYNVLLLNLRREVLDDSHKYEALAESLDQHEVSKILDDNPLWQIAIYNPTFDDVPLSFFKNDYQVAIVPSHIVDDRVPVIQKNGQRAFISGSNPPTVPTLYLSKNERIIGEKKTSLTGSSLDKNCRLEPVASDSKHDYYRTDDYYNDCGPIGTPYDGPPANADPDELCPDADRVSNDSDDNLYKFRLDNMTVWRRINEPFDGAQEFHVNVVFASSNESVLGTKKVFFVKGYMLKDCNVFGSCRTEDRIVDLDIVRWVYNRQGGNMRYFWQEFDDGDKETREINVEFEDEDGNVTTTGKYTIESTDKSDDLGDALVDFCKPTTGEGSRFQTGSINFYVRQQ